MTEILKPQPKGPICLRCGKVMLIPDQIGDRKWCFDCHLILKDMSFDGEQIFSMALALVPQVPMPKDPTKVVMLNYLQLVNNAYSVLIKMGVVPPTEDIEEEEDEPEARDNNGRRPPEARPS